MKKQNDSDVYVLIFCLVACDWRRTNFKHTIQEATTFTSEGVDPFTSEKISVRYIMYVQYILTRQYFFSIVGKVAFDMYIAPFCTLHFTKISIKQGAP